MTDDNVHISRRKILAGVGAAGTAGALGGLGTSAFFNDEELFANNTLAAGELDLKVDWEEHYSFPQNYGFEDPTYDEDDEPLRVTRERPAEAVEYVGLPDPDDPTVWVHEDDLEQYMANTAIEAFPDPDGDGQQEINVEDGFTYDPCQDGADTDEHLDPTGDGLRTNNEGTYDADAQAVRPLVSLADVKPGDFGEFTLSFHLCDNPGYVWLQAANVQEAENGMTDPESEVDSTDDDAELAENIQTIWWYDTNGNNVVDSSIGAVDVMLAVDTSGSLDQGDVDDLMADANALSNDLDATGDARVGGLSFGGGSIDDFTALADGPAEFNGLSPDGNTPMPAALEIAAAELDVNGRQNADTFIVLFTDGGPNYESGDVDNGTENKTYTSDVHTVGPYTEGTADAVVTDGELCETANIAAGIRADHTIRTVGVDDDGLPTNNGDPQDCDGNDIASLSQYLRDYIAGGQADYYSADDTTGVGPILNDILADIAMEEQVFRRGTLEEDLDLLADGAGLPLDGDLTTDFDELNDDPTSEDRECFQPGVNYYVGFGWWLPSDVGNEVQSDGVGFDLGFYTEQCRNNDGAGPA
jgi:predicted ribosomally synthesized peptide with SipW-like signal peptide